MPRGKATLALPHPRWNGAGSIFLLTPIAIGIAVCHRLSERLGPRSLLCPHDGPVCFVELYGQLVSLVRWARCSTNRRFALKAGTQTTTNPTPPQAHPPKGTPPPPTGARRAWVRTDRCFAQNRAPPSGPMADAGKLRIVFVVDDSSPVCSFF